MKLITFKASEDWRNHLNAISGKNTSAYIIQAIEEKADRDGQPFPVAAVAPHGVRSDALPTGWKSRLYKDRYQLVAEYTVTGFEVCHLHEYGKLPENVFGTLRVESPAMEITIVGVPSGASREDVAHDVRLAVMEMDLS